METADAVPRHNSLAACRACVAVSRRLPLKPSILVQVDRFANAQNPRTNTS